ncbi:hypothetical protein ABVE29_003962 [Providencia stuartii]
MKKTILFTSLLISGVALADPVVPSVSNIERINTGQPLNQQRHSRLCHLQCS